MGRNLQDLFIFVGIRLLELLPVLLGVIILTFLVTHVAAINPCPRWYPKASAAVLAHCQAQFAAPETVQFWNYLSALLAGNWGASQLGQPVLPVIASAVPATLELVLAATFLMGHRDPPRGHRGAVRGSLG